MRTNVIVEVPTKELWIKVVQKALDNGYKWDGDNSREVEEYHWDSYEENSCVDTGVENEDNVLQFGPKRYYQEYYPAYPIITAEEFLNDGFYGNVIPPYTLSTNTVGSITLTYPCEIISEDKTKMNKLTSMLKRILDPEAQTLYKAGFIDGNMALTSRGQEALNAILFTANKAELVKQAEEELKEEKENK